MTKNLSDEKAPATKADVRALKADFRHLEELINTKAEETKRHFDVVAEQLQHDYVGIFDDRTKQNGDALRDLKKRLRAVERRVGLAV